MFSCLDKQVTQMEFAALVGVTSSAISALIARGALPREATARQWLFAYLERLRSAATGRGGDAQADLTQARIREANAKALKTEVEIGRELRALVDANGVELALSGWVARGVQAIDGAEQRIVDAIQSEFSIELEERHVREHLHLVRRDLAAYPSELTRDHESSGNEMDAARTGTDG